jgi:putative toxin-antitoxin system antitoxin component (TIGR02293 family)
MVVLAAKPTLSIIEAKRILKQAGIDSSQISGFLGIREEAFTRMKRRSRLEPIESKRVELIDQTFRLAENLLGDADAARSYLHSRIMALENRTPLECLNSISGYERIRDSLMAQAYGMF